MKLLEYADYLQSVGIDRRICRIYRQMSEMLGVFLTDGEVSALEREIIADCETMGAERAEYAGFPYAWLIEPCADVGGLGRNGFWVQIVDAGGLVRFGSQGTLEERKKWHVYSAGAACILIVAYAESIQCGRVRRDDVLTFAAVMNDLAFIVADAAFFGSSAPAVEKQRQTRKRRKAAEEGASKSFKQRFKKDIFNPACIKFLAKGRKRGDKAAFIREIQNDYDIVMRRAKRNGDTLGKNDEVLDSGTVKNWIKEMENKISKFAA